MRSIIILTVFILSAQQVFSQDLSDDDIKQNVMAIEQPLKRITSLAPKKFEFNTEEFNHLKLPQGLQYGFITEEFGQVFPTLVYNKQYSYMRGKNIFRKATVSSVDMQGLIPVLVAAVKEQQTQIEQLRREIEQLKKRHEAR